MPSQHCDQLRGNYCAGECRALCAAVELCWWCVAMAVRSTHSAKRSAVSCQYDVEVVAGVDNSDDCWLAACPGYAALRSGRRSKGMSCSAEEARGKNSAQCTGLRFLKGCSWRASL